MNQSQDREQIQQLKEECIRISEEKIRVSKQFEKSVQRSLQIIENYTNIYKNKNGLKVQQGQDINELNNRVSEIYTNHIQQQNSQEENEKYCICQKNANGAPMIQCDNSSCKIQWYHFSCLGLTKQEVEANDKWFCRYCTIK